MDIQLADVTVHMDENLDAAMRKRIEDKVRAIEGVVAFHNPENRPHLAVVEYNPERVNSKAILAAVTSEGIHAELIGL